MKKTFLSAIGLAVMTSTSAIAAVGDTATATANWQGVVPGVIQSDNLLITGKDKALTTPIGQLMRDTEGNLFGTVIQLEARDNTSGDASDPQPGELLGDVTPTARNAEWTVTDVAFFADGSQITDLEWSIKHDATEIATYAGNGVTSVATFNEDILKLNVSSTNSSMVDQYTGKNAALSVSLVLTEI